MKFKKGTFLLILLVMLGLVLAACGGGADDSADGDKGAGGEGATEEVEQVLNFVNGDTIPTMDSSLATDQYAFEFLGATMEGLYRLSEGGEIVEGIAYDHEISEDGLTWTFFLREDAKWSNGDPVTAHDFVYAWRRAVDPNTGSEYGPYMMNGVIKNADKVNAGELPVEELGVEAKDDYTLVVHLENPVPYFESLTAFGTFYPLNQEFVESQGDKYAQSTENLIFNGPFTLENWSTTANEWSIVKNPNYWDADNVTLERANFVVVKEHQTAVDLYEQGEVDRVGLSSEQVDVYANHPDFTILPEASVFYLKFNQERNGEETPLANKNLRKAIAMAIDKEAYVNNILNNGSMVATGLIPKGFVEVPGTGEDFREANGDLIVYDPDAAKEYWEKAKQELGVDTVELELLGGDSELSIETNEYFKNQIETTLDGVKVTIKSVPFAQRLDLDNKQDYDIQVAGWSPDYLDPNTFLNLWVTGGGNNKMSFSNEEYDRLINEAATTYAQDQEKRYQNFLEAEKILMEEAAIAPLYQRQRALLVSPKIEGILHNQVGADYDYKWAKVVPVEEE